VSVQSTDLSSTAWMWIMWPDSIQYRLQHLLLHLSFLCTLTSTVLLSIYCSLFAILFISFFRNIFLIFFMIMMVSAKRVSVYQVTWPVRRWSQRLELLKFMTELNRQNPPRNIAWAIFLCNLYTFVVDALQLKIFLSIDYDSCIQLLCTETMMKQWDTLSVSDAVTQRPL
jgi:hypothetical protein